MLRKIHLRSSMLAILAAVLGGHDSAAQQAGAPLEVRVINHAGAPVTGATVEVRDTVLNVSRTVKTNASGEFSFRVLPAGNYEVRVTANGFAPHTEQVTLGINIAKKVEVRLSSLNAGGPVRSTSAGVSAGSMRAVQWSLSTKNELEQHLATGGVLVQLIPLKDKTSVALFDQAGGTSGPYTVVELRESLRPDNLARAAAGHQGKRLLGAHRVGDTVYLLVFR